MKDLIARLVFLAAFATLLIWLVVHLVPACCWPRWH